MENTIKERLIKTRLNALQAIFLHQKQIGKLRIKNQLVDILAIGVPVLYFVPRYLFKGTNYSSIIEIIWEALATLLLLVVIFQLVFKWKEKEIDHSTMAHRNRDIAEEALKLSEKQNLSVDVIEQFYKRVQEYDTLDNDKLLIGTKKKQDQEAFRHALQHVFPNGTKPCPKCDADPWKFTSGSCELCGNTPAS
ncbi:MAG: hypothetical protein R2828_29830 [Saprospiraceae bacterium]